MTLVEPHQGPLIRNVDVPREVYWVLSSPVLLAGMKFPRPSFPWASLKAVGFGSVVSLHSGAYDPAPLAIAFSEQLEDVISGGPPTNEANETEKIRKAVVAVVAALQSGQGVVVHCFGGRGRSGTVIGCTLRQLGFEPDEAIAFLDRVHKARGKPGWPESPWQSSLVRGWRPDA